VRSLVSLFSLLAIACLAACSRPEPPTIVAERVRVTSIGPTSIALDVTATVTNPNQIDLVARSLTAHIVVAGAYDVGTVEIPVTTVLPAGRATKLDVPLTVNVKDLSGLAALALASSTIPYSVEGTVGLGGDLIHVELPYRLESSIPKDQLVSAAMKGLGAAH
jgi:LEA14-like dessication related protein